MRLAVSHVFVACLLTWLLFTSVSTDAQDQPSDQDAADAPIREVIAKFVDAYNAGDADALASLWEEDGVMVDESAGDKIVGRDAIRRDYKSLFEQKADLSLGGHLESIRFVTPGVAEVTGRAIVRDAANELLESTFKGIFVRNDDQWQIDSIHESLVPPPSEQSNPLQSLEFLVGRWVDDVENVRVDTSTRWGAGNSFLVRACTVRTDESETYQTTQVIGWDPREKRIRSWMFDSDGCFGEGSWAPSEDGWIVKITQTLSDGRIAGGTQVIKQADEDTLTFHLLDREIEGDAIPADDPVVVVRVEDKIEE